MDTLNTTQQIVLTEDVRVCEELADRIKPGHTLELVERAPEVGDWVIYQVGSQQYIKIYDVTNLESPYGVIKTGIRRHLEL